MKPIFAHYLSAFLLSAATTAISLPAFSAPIPQTAIAIVDQMLTSSTASTVTSSGVVGNHHLIRVAVASHALKTLTISIPSQMEGFSNIQVTDQTGKAITSKISANQQQVIIAFDQAVTPGSALEIDFSGVPQLTPWNQVLEYGVSAEQEGLRGQIPLGTARVQVPFGS